MQTSQSTTPHGRRPYSLALMETQIVAQSCPAETIAHKWQVLDDIRKAKDAIGVSDRTIAVLNALLSFHQETTLTGGEPIVVFPSNKSLAQRANGMAENSLRRHLSVLVFLGLDLSSRQPEWKTLRAERGGGRDRRGLWLRSQSARCSRRGIQAPGDGGDRRREATPRAP